MILHFFLFFYWVVSSVYLTGTYGCRSYKTSGSVSLHLAHPSIMLKLVGVQEGVRDEVSLCLSSSPLACGFLSKGYQGIFQKKVLGHTWETGLSGDAFCSVTAVEL